MKTSQTYRIIGAFFASVGFLMSGHSLFGEMLIFQESFEEEGRQIIAEVDNNPTAAQVPAGSYVVIGGGTVTTDQRQSVERRRFGDAGVATRGGVYLDGEWMFVARRMTTTPRNAANFEGENLTDRHARLKFFNIDTAGYGNLRIKLAMSVSDPGHEPNDDFVMRVRFDNGEWLPVGGFRTASSNTYPIYFEGNEDHMNTWADTQKLTRFFTEWEWPIKGHGNVMEIQFDFEGNAFDEDWYMDNVRIYGTPNLNTMTASFLLPTIVEPVTGGVPNPLTINLAQPAPEGGVTVTLTPRDRRDARMLSLPETVLIPQGQSSVVVPVEVIQDGQFTGTANRADVVLTADGCTTTFAYTRITDVSPRPQIIFTEVCNIVPGINTSEVVFAPVGDISGNGVYERTDDTFVELLNVGSTPADISFYRIGDDLADRHLVPEGTILAPMQAFVVFSGGSARGAFGGAIVQICSGGGNGLGMNRTSRNETMYLNSSIHVEVDRCYIEIQYSDFTLLFGPKAGDPPQGLEANDPRLNLSSSQSRQDLTWTEPGFKFTLEHITAFYHSLDDNNIPNLPGYRADQWGGANMVLYVPGYRWDGQYYFEPSNVVTMSIDNSSFAEDAGANAAEVTITLEKPAPTGGLELMLASEGFNVTAGGSVEPIEIDIDSHIVVVPAGATEYKFRVGAYNDGVLDGDKTVGIKAYSDDPYLIPGTVDVTVLDVEISDYNVVINEFFMDAIGPGVDPNMDGQSNDDVGDQFVEIVNMSGRPINMSGWRLWWVSVGAYMVPTDSHYFPQGTWVPDGGSIVVFGKISEEAAQHPDFHGAVVQPARLQDGSLKINGVAFVINLLADYILENQYGFEIHRVSQLQGTMTNQDQAVTRSPDLTGDFMMHLDAHMAAGGFGLPIYSPGADALEVAFPGNSTVLLPHVFKGSREAELGMWLNAPGIGYYTPVTAYGHAMPWAYSASAQAFWYVRHADGWIWVYDMTLGAWCGTTQAIYPWMYKRTTGTTGEWIDRSAM
jgi:hypothetical protein